MQLSSAYLKEKLRSDFIKKIGETFFTQILSLSINFLSIILISRFLGPTLRGVLATAMAVVALGVQFGNMGLHASNTYFVAQDRKLLPIVIGNTLFIATGLGCLISLLIWIFSAFYPSLIPINGPLLFLLVPLSLAHLLFQNILIGIHEVRTYNKGEILLKFSSFLLMLLIALSGIRNPEIILLANIFALILSLLYAWQKIKPDKLQLSFSYFKQSLFYGFRSYIVAFFSFLVLRIDLLMIKQMLGFEQAGYYSIAANMADLLSVFPATVGTLLFPKILAISNPLERLKMVKKTAFVVFLLMGAIGLSCFLLAKTAIVFLLGPAFLSSVPAFLWLLPGLILLSVNIIFMNYFASIGIPWISIVSPGLAALANIILNITFIPSMGIVGASIASTLCYGSMLLMSLLYLRSKDKRKTLITECKTEADTI